MRSQFYTTSHTRTAAGRPLTPSESQADTCKVKRSRPTTRRSASFWHAPSVHGMRGNHPPISQNPASPAAAQRGSPAEEGRARVRSGATGGAGEGSAPVPRPAVSQPPRSEAPGQSTPGPPAPLSGQRGPTYSATILLGTFGGPPRQNYTTFREILDFPSRHQMARIQREGQI